jgi:hypothetical protein
VCHYSLVYLTLRRKSQQCGSDEEEFGVSSGRNALSQGEASAKQELELCNEER